MAQQDFPRIQSEIKLGAPATTDEFEITEGRGAKKMSARYSRDSRRTPG